jgi:hypothetical protein
VKVIHISLVLWGEKKEKITINYVNIVICYCGILDECTVCVIIFLLCLESHTIIVSEKYVPSGGWTTGNKSCQGLVARVGDCQQLIKVFSFPLGEAFLALDLGCFLLLFVYSFVCWFLSFFIPIYCKV